VAWSTFMTGKNPGKHNIYGFQDRRPRTYDTFIPLSTSMKSETLWEILSRAGKRVGVMNVPVTYPPRQVNGFLVGCFLSPDLDKATHPPELAGKLRELGYRIDVDPWKGREKDKGPFLEDLDKVLEGRARTMFHLMENEEWDFFMTHFMGTDRINHFLWEQMERGEEPYASAFLDYYRKIDRIIADLASRLDESTTLIVLSDHGFCSVKKEVYVNRWLVEGGWLVFDEGKEQSIKAIDERTRAFSLDPGRIYLNLQGREPRGSVRPGEEYEAARAELIEGISGLADPESGEPMIERVVKREEIYSGGAFDSAPDLIAVPRRGFDLKGALNKPRLLHKGELVGMHTYDDAFLFIRGEAIARDGFSIIDVMPTILSLLEVPVPPDVDGHSLLEAGPRGPA
jgi:predicted AlkP superfamily phosphohydrolase/phosphomutase